MSLSASQPPLLTTLVQMTAPLQMTRDCCLMMMYGCPLIAPTRPAPGVCFYPRESLPGYCAIFREWDDSLNMCYYLIPHGKGNGQCGAVKVPPAWLHS